MEIPAFDSVPVEGLRGRIILTRFPGRGAADDFCAQRLERVLEGLAGRGCRTVVSLTEDREFAAFCGKALFGERVSAHGLTWHHLPIRDFEVPDRTFLERWEPVRTELMEELRSGHDVCLHCKGGMGRSGTVAALMLVEHGVRHEEAIALVRRSRQGAIETAEQEAFVSSYRKSRSPERLRRVGMADADLAKQSACSPRATR